uniref:VWFD domain-containing protein n=1 Tax=Vombatus ursinus TaxID=29139 RepID=A0A4X2M914_VOMUR
CGPNSHYEPCGSACPATCVDQEGGSPHQCALPCLETCACDPGFVLSGATCVPRKGPDCGCLLNGLLLGPGEAIWAGPTCGRRCWCPAGGGQARCGAAGCGPDERCAVSGGVRGCRATRITTCRAAGAGHFQTFDGLRYRFTASCSYLLSGLRRHRSGRKQALTPFRVLLKAGPAGVPRGVEVYVPGCRVRLDQGQSGRVLVNGAWRNLPCQVGSRILIFRRGWDTVVSCPFGLKVAFDGGSHLVLALPRSYAGRVAGLCANFDGDPANDLFPILGPPPVSGLSSALALVHSCRIGATQGCREEVEESWQGTSGKCKGAISGCDVLIAPDGPFHPCHHRLPPQGFFNDCLRDACLIPRRGACPIIGDYAAACQEEGILIYPWRTPDFCPPCPAHSHYELCGPACPITCGSLSGPAGCQAGRCREGCVCDRGFALSGARCVPLHQCGCLLSGHYYEPGLQLPEIWGAPCRGPCICQPGGQVFCPCRASQGALAPGVSSPGLCLVSGGPHCRTFDGATFRLRGHCSYTLAGTVPNCPAGLPPFSVTVDNEPYRAAISGVRAFMQGASMVLVARGGPRLLLSQDPHLSLTLSAAYQGYTLGLCGNYNGNSADDLLSLAPGPGLQSCPLPQPCPSPGCPTVGEAAGAPFQGSNSCGLLMAAQGPFAPCHGTLSPGPFFQSCLADVIHGRGSHPVLCRCLRSYVAACQEAGARVLPWRSSTLCPMQCPRNSHYSLCADPCPAACPGVQAIVRIPARCAEGCQCDPGFFPAAGACVPLENCPCFHRGLYFSAFWTEGCARRCRCPAAGGPWSTGIQCWPARCQGRCEEASGGGHRCQPIRLGSGPQNVTCTASGDFRFQTFGGTRYSFPGSCVYRLAGPCSTGGSSGLGPFYLDMATHIRPLGCFKSLTLRACGLRMDMSPVDPNLLRVDGVLELLPFFRGRCLRAYTCGGQLCLDTASGLSLTYDWDSLVRLSVPRALAGSLCGLCGDRAGGIPSSPLSSLAGSWKVAEIPGCGPFCGPRCPLPCPATQSGRYRRLGYCGLLGASAGPLAPCHRVLNPVPFMEDCLDDVCQHRGCQRALCRALVAYVTACQAQGVRLRPWRTPSLCPLQCPAHSHYELCGPRCPLTCGDLKGAKDCQAGDHCQEGCVCNAGFVLSGATCVPRDHCGCLQAGRYHALGTTWYPGPGCERRCHCGAGGTVSCGPGTCSSHEVCTIHRGIRGCFPDGRVTCFLAGPTHGLTFDGRVFGGLAGQCAYLLARATGSGLEPFAVITGRVWTDVRGARIPRTQTVTLLSPLSHQLDGERCRLPLVLPGGRLWVTREGRLVAVQAACGLRLFYDSARHLRLTVPSTYQGRLSGLCGNFDADGGIGDFGPTGSLETFVVSWALPGPGPCSPTGPCPPCPPGLDAAFSGPSACGLLRLPRGPFGHCHSFVRPDPFHGFCLRDMCRGRGGRLGLCDSLTAYTEACQEAGALMQPWRGPKLCPLRCPPRSHYSICARTCDLGCAPLLRPTRCSPQCFEGCECDRGFIYDGARCVPQERCGCFHLGRYIRVSRGRWGREFNSIQLISKHLCAGP